MTKHQTHTAVTTITVYLCKSAI